MCAFSATILNETFNSTNLMFAFVVTFIVSLYYLCSIFINSKNSKQLTHYLKINVAVYLMVTDISIHGVVV